MKKSLSFRHSQGGAANANNKISPYAQTDISRTAQHFGYNMRVLIYDGATDKFDIYNLVAPNSKDEAFRKNICDRDERNIPFLVQALRTYNPERFTEGSPSFQLLFAETDSVKTPCINHPKDCVTSSWAPIFAFSTVPKDPFILPSVKAFPIHSYVGCLADWYSQTHEHVIDKAPWCYFPSEPFPSHPWANLTNQVFWRGSDYPTAQYLDEFSHLVSRHELLKESSNLTKAQAAELLLEDWDILTPRFRGVALSIQAEADAEENDQQQLPWIDCKFPASPKFLQNLNKTTIPKGYYHMANYVPAEEMAKYRYQIDFGGYGGTTWVGTVSKLAMPGLLFHHETPMKDWYFDDMEPWVHYVPIKWDLSDLYEKYEWAEAHPTKAAEIAKAGTEFAMKLMSDEYRKALFEKLYVGYGREAVEAYQPSEHETVESILSGYVSDGFDVYHFSQQLMDKQTKSCWESATSGLSGL